MSQEWSFVANKDTILQIGSNIAHILEKKLLHTVFLLGDYGVGKTTIVRSIVGTLIQREPCEVSSPSFTGCNIYPTIPVCIHVDLYSMQSTTYAQLEEEYEEYAGAVYLIEWGAHCITECPYPALIIALEYIPEREEERRVTYFFRNVHDTEQIAILEDIRIG